MSEERQPKGISRRTVAKGMAWAIPAVPLVASAPAYAQSVCLSATFGAESCKGPGAGNDWSYKFEICFENTCGAPVDIWINYLQNNSGSRFFSCTGNTVFPLHIVVPGGTTANPGEACLDSDWFRATSSAGTVEVWGSFNTQVPDGDAALIASIKTTGQDASALGICDESDGDNPCPVPDEN